MFTRRRLLWTGAAAAAAAAAYPVAVEPRWFELTRHRVPAIPGARQFVRVLHLSDLHASWAVPLSSIEAAIRMGLAGQPDIVCLTGDFITYRDFDSRAYAAALRQLTAARPAFAVLGNHDGGVWAYQRRGFADHQAVERLLEDAGIVLLHNRSVETEARGCKLNIVGVGDLWSHELRPDPAFRGLRGGAPVLLLSHNPDSKELLKPYRWDLMLCGHTHGGQVMIPFEGPRYAPVADLRFVSGLHAWNGRSIYITRGVGNLGGVRFLCRPEVSILDVGAA